MIVILVLKTPILDNMDSRRQMDAQALANHETVPLFETASVAERRLEAERAVKAKAEPESEDLLDMKDVPLDNARWKRHRWKQALHPTADALRMRLHL